MRLQFFTHAIVSFTAVVFLSRLTSLCAQDTVTVHVSVSDGRQPLADALVREGRIGGRTGEDGAVRLALPPGIHTLVASKLGFRTDSLPVVLESGHDTAIVITLVGQAVTAAPVVITATRTEQRIEDVPLRVEVLTGEDVGEKTAMRPGDLTKMVAEIPGVRVQPATAGTGGANLRVQGMRGQYTEFLTDGLPLGGASETGLSLVQVPPLDLAQIEVIKGAASALYGPSALAGVVNFVTRRAPADRDSAIREVVVSAASDHALDAVGFAGKRLRGPWSFTLLGGAHRQPSNDADRDGWADVAASTRGEIRPRLFWKGTRGASIMLTAGASGDNRTGGEVQRTKTSNIHSEDPNATVPLRERVVTRRGDFGFTGKVPLSGGTLLNMRGSAALLGRTQSLGTISSRDRSTTSLGEVSATRALRSVLVVAGAALRGDDYSNKSVDGFDYRFWTSSLFAQGTFAPSEAVSVSVTGRCDWHNLYGASCVPLAALLLRQPSGWTERLSGALGAYAPTPFVEGVQPTDFASARPFTGPGSTRLEYERARNASVDVGYRSGGLDVNATAYASEIHRPAIFDDAPVGKYFSELLNAPIPTRTRGLDVFAVYTGDPLSVTAFYGVLRSREFNPRSSFGATSLEREVPLNPSRRAGLDVAVDAEETGSRFAIEAYYTGRQSLEDDPYRTNTPAFTTVELLATQNFRGQQIFLSAENVTNVRQTNYGPRVLPRPTLTGRATSDTWGPLEGRVLRLGMKAQF